MNVLEVETKAAELERQIAPSIAVASEIVVRDAESYKTAGEMLKDLTGLEKQIKTYWEDDVAAALRLHRSLVAKRDAMLVPVGEKKTALRLGMKSWDGEQERIRRELQAKADAEARKAAEDAALAEAVELERNGNKAAAEAVMAAPVAPAPVFIPKTTPGGYGQFTRKIWNAEVVDMLVLVKAVAAGHVPIQALQADKVFLNAQARSLKGAMAYPGVRAVES